MSKGVLECKPFSHALKLVGNSLLQYEPSVGLHLAHTTATGIHIALFEHSVLLKVAFLDP